MKNYLQLVLAFVLCILATLISLQGQSAPGGPQSVIYYSDGLKLLKSKLYLTDGTLSIALGTTASGGNVAFGGESSASASTSYPVLIERTLANAVLMQISNPSSNSAASAKIQLSTDAGDKLGELGIFPDEATTAAYTSAMTVRPNGNATRLSLIGGDLSTGHVAFYTAGDYASTGEALRVNADKSAQLMQQIATPATPVSGSGKIYLKSGDGLYFLDDNGTETRLDSLTSSSTSRERFERAKLFCTASSSIISQSGSWVSSIGNVSGDTCTVTIANGTFSAAPVCVTSLDYNTSATTIAGNVNVVSSTSVELNCNYDSGSGPNDCTNVEYNLICMGPR